MTKLFEGCDVRPIPADEMKDWGKRMREAEEERARDAQNKKQRERAERLAARAALPIEQRIADIEQWIEDYRPQYVPPPRFR